MKYLAHLAEPATLVAALLLLGVIYSFYAASRGQGRRLGWFWLGLLFVYLGFASPLGGNALLRPLEMSAQDAANRCRADAPAPTLAVVLAGGIEADALTAADYHVLSESSLRRTIAAAQWAHGDPTRRLLLSGGFGKVTEAQLMARFLADLGVQAGRIDQDSVSTNTAQSADNVAAQLRQAGTARVLLITSADHMPRAAAALQRRSISTCALPVEFRYVAPLLPGHLVPQLTALTKSTRALHEYFSLLRDGVLNALD
ncbi:MAG: YdcF family protein [Burkholderiaceae bacterium]